MLLPSFIIFIYTEEEVLMSYRLCLIFAVAVFSSSIAGAQTVSTDFATSDGFITGPQNGAAPAAGAFSDVTISDLTGAFSTTFSGGQQQQGFDGPSYNGDNAAYLFVNTGPGAAVFAGASGNTITGGDNNSDDGGLISFSGAGAGSVSFFAADRANGANTGGTVFDTSGAALTTFTIPSGNVSDNQFTFTEAALGGAIGSISFDLPGPNANAPYAAAIDSFTATASTASVPEPSSMLALLGTLAIAGLRRRR